MYRILMSRTGKAYAFDLGEYCYDDSDEFTEDLRQFTENGDVLVILEDIDDFEDMFPDYELIITKND